MGKALSKRTGWLWKGWILVCLFLAGPFPTVADEWVPAVRLKEEYNDNIFFDPSDGVDDFITTIAPKITFDQKTERHRFLVSAEWIGLLYADNDDLNTVDQAYTGRITYHMTPRFEAGMDARYIVDSRPDRDIAETGLQLGTEIRRRQHVGGTLGYLFTEAATLNLAYAFDGEDFEDSDNKDVDTHSATMGLSYDLGRYITGTHGRFHLGVDHSIYRSATVDTYSLTVGFLRVLSERFSVSADAGTRFTRSAFDGLSGDMETWGALAQLAVNYRGEYTQTTFSFFHDVSTASGFIGSTERTGLRFDMRRRFTERFSGIMAADYYWNRSGKEEFAVNEIDTRTLRLQPRLRYEILRELALELAYTYADINDNADDLTRRQHIIFLQLVLQYPDLNG